MTRKLLFIPPTHFNLISQKKLKHLIEKPLSQIHNCEEVDVL